MRPMFASVLMLWTISMSAPFAAAQCDGWESLGGNADAAVYALRVHDGQLIAAGNFTTVDDVPANRIARWNGSAWSAFGNGVDGTVRALAAYDDDLIAGGNFSNADDQPASRIARWDGNTWQPLGEGMNGEVRALTVYNGDLIAAGSFTTAGGVSANRVARWDGSAWHALGGGVGGSVSALAVYDGELIAAGSASSVIAWDGTDWHELGSGGTHGKGIHALAVYDGQLFAGGNFATFGGLAQWNGTTWQSLAGGASISGTVYALAASGGRLIAAGDFYVLGCESIIAGGMVSWNGDWAAVGQNIGAFVHALADYHGVVAGGTFTAVDGMNHVAHWTTRTGIAQHPQSVSATAGENVALTVVSDGSAQGPVTYQWRRNGAHLINGGNITGALTDTLSISDVSTDDFGAYDVLISSACGVVASHPAAVAIDGGASDCPADVAPQGGDDIVDVADLLELLSAWGTCP